MPNSDSLTLREASKEDVDTVYQWQIHPQSRRFFHEPAPPSYAEHKEWFYGSVKSSERYLYIIEYGDQQAGVIRLDNMAGESPIAELSILIAPDFQKKGLAKKAVKLVQAMYADLTLLATVHKENAVSQKLFRACGFVQEDDTKFYCHPKP